MILVQNMIIYIYITHINIHTILCLDLQLFRCGMIWWDWRHGPTCWMATWLFAMLRAGALSCYPGHISLSWAFGIRWFRLLWDFLISFGPSHFCTVSYHLLNIFLYIYIHTYYIRIHIQSYYIVDWFHEILRLWLRMDWAFPSMAIHIWMSCPESRSFCHVLKAAAING